VSCCGKNPLGTAFQEVEDNLAALRILSHELEEQNAAIASAQRTLSLAT
jgi:outer membrane protein TolC